jgi:hypothetical protein
MPEVPEVKLSNYHHKPMLALKPLYTAMSKKENAH